jgi:hypothetical protein
MKKTKTDWIAMTQQEMSQPMKGFRSCMGRTNQRLDKSFIIKEGCYKNAEDISGKIWARGGRQKSEENILVLRFGGFEAGRFYKKVFLFVGFISLVTREISSYTDKKENIFLIYKDIQNGAVAKSYITNGLLIYGEIFAHFFIY